MIILVNASDIHPGNILDPLQSTLWLEKSSSDQASNYLTFYQGSERGGWRNEAWSGAFSE